MARQHFLGCLDVLEPMLCKSGQIDVGRIDFRLGCQNGKARLGVLT